MIRMLKIWRFVKLIDEANEILERDNPPKMRLSGFEGIHVATFKAKQKYLQNYPKITSREINHIAADAFKEGYLDGVTQEIQGEPIDAACLTGKGRALIDGGRIIPWWGLLRAWTSEDGKMIALLGTTIGTSGAIVWAIIQYLLNHAHGV